jgi:phage shock protein E
MFKFRYTKPIVYTLLVVLTMWLFNNATANGNDIEAAKKAWVMVDKGALLVDVRSKEEFDTGHLEGALNINWDNFDALIAAIGDDHQRPVVFYCRTGNRVGKSIKELENRGYTNIFNGTGLEAMKATKP